ncbi:FIST C-terminal domain-containing protein [Chondromyces crocatus]|nr:FIST C-terminal domain-containing protein [Chondromyces crocatus]
MTGHSFSAACGLDGLRSRLVEARRAVRAPVGALLFLSGGLVQRLPAVAEVAREIFRGVATCLVPAAGVLSERGELEGEAGVSGMLWEGGDCAPFAAPARDVAGAVALLLEPSGPSAPSRQPGARPRTGTVLLFMRPEAVEADTLSALSDAAPGSTVLGAGTVGANPIVILASGEVREAAAVGLVLTGLAPPLVETAGACRLLSEFHPIDEVTEGGLVLSVGGKPALDLLSSCTNRVGRPRPADPAEPAPVVFAALADPASTSEASPRFVVRPVRGLDTARRGLMIGDAARRGVRLAFAVRDATTARSELAAATQRISRGILGASPRFALYLTCAGRGQSLYGARDVEARILRSRFGDLPIAGMHSAFELVPWNAESDARIALYSSVLALFRAPS